MNLDMICFGGAHVDIKAQAKRPVMLTCSNPVRTMQTFGGVARNVAENAARLGLSVGVVSRVGTDQNGASVLAHLRACQMDVSSITQSTTSATGTYTALLEPDGNMTVALADMDIYDEMTPTLLKEVLTQIPSAPYWLVDTNLSEESLGFLAQVAPPDVKLWAIAASALKIERLRAILHRLDGVILNDAELAVLVGCTRDVGKLRSHGVEHVVITKGDESVCFASSHGIRNFAVKKARATDVTGAGDALCAGVLFGMIRHQSIDQMMQLGLDLAREAVCTMESTA